MKIKNQFIILTMLIVVGGCSKHKEPIELIDEFELARTEAKFNESIASAEESSLKKLPTIEVITFFSEPVPSHFYALHTENGFDMTTATIGNSPVRELPTFNTKVDLPEEATRTQVILDLDYLRGDEHNHD